MLDITAKKTMKQVEIEKDLKVVREYLSDV